MRIGITGSWRDKDEGRWDLQSDLKTFGAACHEIGVAIAESGSVLAVGSDSGFTADKYAVEGYLSVDSEGLSVRVVRPRKGSYPFQTLYERHPDKFVYLTGPSSTWRHTRQQFVSDIDALVTVGGADGTYQAALELRLTRKRLVPVGTFGGASARLLAELRASATPQYVQQYERLSNPWTPQLASHIMTLLRANQPSKILLIHGHAADRAELEEWLRHEDLADPVIMAQEFTAGQTLPEKFELLADEADAAIALATPDDLASLASETDVKKLRARQNVWVEVGWFWGRLGRHRVLLLVRGNVEIPSDLDGIEYHAYQRSALEAEAGIRRFLLAVSKRNQ